ncbi:MAG: DUF815 domain-containing protein [Nitrosopumilales archaeon]|nr:DUF815 domain-containing protein [Nitrosopumilales archaeon]
MELTKKAIVSIRKDIAKQNSVFSDKKYLDSLFLPSSIIGRRKQAKQLLKHIESLKQGFVVPQISVYGRSGSGKSTVVKFVCQNIQDIVAFAFVNLRKSKTVFGCANFLKQSRAKISILVYYARFHIFIEQIFPRDRIIFSVQV